MIKLVLLTIIIFIFAYLQNNKNKLENDYCDSFYLKYKIHFDTSNVKLYSDEDIRYQFFPNFKRIYPTINADDCIFDIGSNIGDITALFHSYYINNRIFLAEPLELNYEKTLERFNSSKQIVIINTAIGFKKKAIYWNHNKAGSMMYFKRILRISNITFLDLDTFYDIYATQGNIFFLKIDVEGYEDEVLFSSRNLLSKGKIKIIYFEYHFICKTKCSKLVMDIEHFGYNCYLVGKYKIIRIKKQCYNDIDKHKLPHIFCIKNKLKYEKRFIDKYNELYMKNIL